MRETLQSLSIDAEQVFDQIQQPLLIKKKWGGRKIPQHNKARMTNPQVNILVTGEILMFLLRSGTQQRC